MIGLRTQKVTKTLYKSLRSMKQSYTEKKKTESHIQARVCI